ncbi:MAG TPA: diacylglycerol kinase family protein [Candidatus Desulfaltia sp.]|nr:diacylglycerol kinase family protein [Candidatus Desulfaltia sp.]
MPTDRIVILFNPSAGKGMARRKKPRLERLLRKWDIPHDLIVTQSEDDLRALTRECAGRYRVLTGAGGDSTFQIMIDELARAGAEVDFGLIPLGSSNDIAREFGLLSLEKACQALKGGRTRTIDLGAVHHQGRLLNYFIGQVNIGLGVQVNRYVEEFSRKWPRFASLQSLAGTLGVLRSYRRKEVPLSLSVQTEDQEKHGRFVVASFNNIRFWASGRTLNPSARPDDERLDGCLITDCSFLRLAHLAFLARKGRHVGAPEVTFLAAPTFSISSERGFDVQVDGEIIGGYRTPQLFQDIQVRAVPRALRMICRES